MLDVKLVALALDLHLFLCEDFKLNIINKRSKITSSHFINLNCQRLSCCGICALDSLQFKDY